MTIKQAIKILEQYNKWRRGNWKIKMQDPKDIGKAIDVATQTLTRISKNGQMDKYQF